MAAQRAQGAASCCPVPGARPGRARTAAGAALSLPSQRLLFPRPFAAT